jgi:hypothetical protein
MFRGTVWHACKEDLPQDSGKRIPEYLSTVLPKLANKVQIVGLGENAALIVKIADTFGLDNISIELVSPLVCRVDIERMLPDIVLQRMKMFQRSPSQGGFHRLTQEELVNYRMAEMLHNNAPGPVGDISAYYTKIQLLLKQHPVWPALSFVQPLDPYYVFRVLARIRDPRWYVNPSRPERDNRLLAYLSLEPRIQARASCDAQPPQRGQATCREVLCCWKIDNYVHKATRYLDAIGVKPVAESRLPGLRPCDFLWRVWGKYAVGEGRSEMDGIKGDLRASQLFISFLRSAWLDAIYRETGTSLFDAERIFRYPCEREAFAKHMQTQPR